MVALTFLAQTKIVEKPHINQYERNPQTLGEHIRKKRIESNQLQKDVAEIIGVSEDSLTYWENDRAHPQVHHYPAIFRYLGYYPFDHDIATFSGLLQKVRYLYGWTCEELAERLGVFGSTISGWEVLRTVPTKKNGRRIKPLLKELLTTTPLV